MHPLCVTQHAGSPGPVYLKPSLLIWLLPRCLSVKIHQEGTALKLVAVAAERSHRGYYVVLWRGGRLWGPNNGLLGDLSLHCLQGIFSLAPRCKYRIRNKEE